MKKQISQLLVIIPFGFLMACSQSGGDSMLSSPPPTKPTLGATGTSDGGGGGIESSSPEQIKEAVETEYKRLFNTSIPKYLLNSTLKEESSMSAEELDAWEKSPIIGLREFFVSQKLAPAIERERRLLTKKIAQIYIVENEKEKTQDRLQEIREIQSQLLKWDPFSDNLKDFIYFEPFGLREYARKIKYRFETDGPCPASNNKHADASVSEYSINGTVCFSLKTLQRIPPSDLGKHIFSLWIHELTHIAGEKSEAIAETAEKIARVSYERFDHPRELIWSSRKMIDRLSGDLYKYIWEMESIWLKLFDEKKNIGTQVARFKKLQEQAAYSADLLYALLKESSSWDNKNFSWRSEALRTRWFETMETVDEIRTGLKMTDIEDQLKKIKQKHPIYGVQTHIFKRPKVGASQVIDLIGIVTGLSQDLWIETY